jgi:HAD superfamily hydrolase (TIGR01509 family)
VADLAQLDAVTIDAYGTLLELRDPVGSLQRILPGQARDAIDRAFRAEMAYYVERSHEGRDVDSLARLYQGCTAVFNEDLGSQLTPEEYVGALEYEFLPGALDTVEALRARGLALAVVANWDISLVERLAPLALPVVTSAEAGAAKPDQRIFALALERLGVPPDRALHVGDSDADAEGARRVGMQFHPAPLATLL